MMDTVRLPEDVPQVPMEERLKDPKIILLGMALLCLAVGVIATMIISSLRPAPPANQVATPVDVSPTRRPRTPEEDAALLKQHRMDVTRIVQDVLSHTKDQSYDQATPYFLYGMNTWQTKEAVVQLLQSDYRRYSSKGAYQAQIKSEDIAISGRRAQVPVTHTIATTTSVSRFDLSLTQDGWRIVQIVYDKVTDLKTPTNVTPVKQSWETAQVTEKGEDVTLPAGDVIRITKSLYTSLRTSDGKHEDIHLKVISAKQNYVIALWNGQEVVETGAISVNDLGSYLQVFDIRPLVETQGGVIMIYREGTVVKRSMTNIPPDPIFQIPIQVHISSGK